MFIREPEKLKQFNTLLNGYLDSISIRKWKKLHGLFISKPELELTVAKRNYESKLLGMHIDNTLSMEAGLLGRSPNRICFNFGEEDRYLLCVNITIIGILNMLKKRGVKIENKDGMRINEKQFPDHFFREFPDYPIMKIRIMPNELYIAPTDNLIHDGSHENKSKVDICLVVLGYFNPIPE